MNEVKEPSAISTILYGIIMGALAYGYMHLMIVENQLRMGWFFAGVVVLGGILYGIINNALFQVMVDGSITMNVLSFSDWWYIGSCGIAWIGDVLTSYAIIFVIDYFKHGSTINDFMVLFAVLIMLHSMHLFHESSWTAFIMKKADTSK